MGRPPRQIEVWGGVECTVNRVGDSYFDQLKYNGHENRPDDLDRFARIGLKALRFPVIWERTAPKGIENADWTWADERLERTRQLDLRPIVGFVHHGSGPRHTNLLDPHFSFKLAEYASAFARRYPWVEDYTPINELFTTARFSALYGIWYPHHKDYGSCFRALFNEARGTVLAMREIRKINPRARLIQTDDLGKASSTPLLKYQADFENEQRWIGWDMLCGRVTPGHPMWEFILGSGVEERELAWFAENPCQPDVIGVNHYLLSNRHLDERKDRYPTWSHGGNHRHSYADVESVRIADAQFIPPETVFREAWERYKIPIAITEVHLDAPREDQLRWYMEIWNSARRLNEQGADICAITAWGLLGHFDWHCLVSRCEGYYESGVFDLRAPEPRPTAIARMLGSLVKEQNFEHPLLDTPGWWRRPVRIRHPESVATPEPGSPESFGSPARTTRARPLLITGARGTLGRAFAQACERRGIPYRLLSRQEMDMSRSESVDAAIDELNPWAVINAAGYVRVDQAESDAEACRRDNVQGPVRLAQASARRALPYVSFSSDMVFGGDTSTPYVESSPIAPLNAYGRSKAEAEKAILVLNPLSLVVRTSGFFEPVGEHNFVHRALADLSRGQVVSAASDVQVSPTYVPELVDTVLNLMIDGESGIWHLANAGAISWAELAREAARRAGLNPARVAAQPAERMGWIAPRPRYSVLGSERGRMLSTLDKALDRFFNESQWRDSRWQRNG